MHLPELMGLDGWLAEREARVPGLRPDCAKRIDWPGAARDRAAVAVVYVHGFSATGREISPVPERIAAGLAAPLFATRLTGHGQDGAAMARATMADWRADVDEALAIGAALGERVIVIGCSTGCTLLTLAMAGGADVAGAIMVSPNYGMASRPLQWLLDAPGIALWGPSVAGKTRSFVPISPAHSAFWTTEYPTHALWPMADCIRAVRRADLGRITAPVLMAYCAQDTVVSPAEIARVADRWGGPVRRERFTMGPGDDTNGHVIAGDVFSPGQTERMVALALDWAGTVL